MSLLLHRSVPMMVLRGYLLAGLIAHKLVWEVLKRRAGARRLREPTGRSLRTRAVKTAKIVILAGLLAQAVLPVALPMADATAGWRIFGAVVYTVGWLVAVSGRIQLGPNWFDIETAAVREGHKVVNHGVYRYIRHPIYTGDVLVLLGFELALNSWLVLGAAVLAPIVLRQALHEESLLKRELPGYPAYCRTTKRFIPFIV